MFQVICGCKSTNGMFPFTLILEGCPRDGVAAIDWRRARGLPAAPSRKVEVPGLSWEDEPFCRAHPGRMNDKADVDLGCREGSTIEHWDLADNEGRVCHETSYGLLYNLLPAEPGPVAAYLAAPTPETGRALLESIWGHSARSKAAAQEKAAAIRAERGRDQKAREDARALLKQEMDELRARAEAAEKCAAYFEQEVARALGAGREEEPEEAEEEV